MSSLNIALFAFRYPCSSIHLCSAITLSFWLLLLSIIPGESAHVSYMTDKSSCSIYPLYAALGHLCVVLTGQGLYPMFDLSPDPIIVISVIPLLVPPFFCPVPSHSCDPLEDLLPSLSQYGSTSALPDDEDLEFWWWYLRIQYPYLWTPLFHLSASLIYWHFVDSPCLNSTYVFTW